MMRQKKAALALLAIVLGACSEDLGPGKFGSNPLTPQSPGVDGSWNLKANYQTVPGNESSGLSMAADKSGHIFSVGYGLGASVKSWIVRRSADRGASWSVVDNFNYGTNLESVANGAVSDPSGNIFVVGQGVANPSSPQNYWLVRKSTDSGQSWGIVDAMTGAPGLYSEAAAVASSPSGRIYVVGTLHDGNKFQWVVRRSNNAGNSWSTVSTYNYPSSTNHARAYAVTVDSNEVLYVGGAAQDANGKYRWVVRKSSDFGANWSTVDDYQMEAGQDSETKALAVDKQGRVFAAGYGFTLLNGKRWVVRRAASGDGPFTTVDNYVHPSDSENLALSSARGLSVDSKNVIYAVGFASTFVGSQKSISVVRKSNDNGASWTTVDAYQPLANANDAAAHALAIDSSDRVFVTGINWIGSSAWFIRGNP